MGLTEESYWPFWSRPWAPLIFKSGFYRLVTPLWSDGEASSLPSCHSHLAWLTRTVSRQGTWPAHLLGGCSPGLGGSRGRKLTLPSSSSAELFCHQLGCCCWFRHGSGSDYGSCSMGTSAFTAELVTYRPPANVGWMDQVFIVWSWGSPPPLGSFAFHYSVGKSHLMPVKLQ